jgi:hypothetical protein
MFPTGVPGLKSNSPHKLIIVGLLLVLLLGMQGCGGGGMDAADSHQYPKVAIVSTTLPDATVGTAYAFKLQATGGSGADYLWGLQSGTLPAGMKFDLDGSLTGTPTVAGTTSLTFNVQHTCFCVPQNQPQSDTKAFNLIVH